MLSKIQTRNQGAAWQDLGINSESNAFIDSAR